MSNQYDRIIWEAGKKHAVDPALIKAIVAAESNFNPKAHRNEPKINDASYGLMQTLLGTARWMGYTGPSDGLYVPENSIEFGTRYLKHQLVRYNGQTRFAVAAYNSGTAYQKENGQFSNQPYVDRVMRYYDQFKLERDLQGGKEGATPHITPGSVLSSPVRVQTYQNEDGETAATFEAFLSDENRPYILAIGVAALFAVLSSRR